MKGRVKIKLIIPIIIFGSSEKQKKYKDDKNRPLIDFNAAVNAAIALNDPNNYSNENDAEKSPSTRLHKQKNRIKVYFIDAIFMKPYIFEIFNIE